MGVKVEHLSPTKVALEIEVDASKVKDHLNGAMSRAVKQVQVPGFRKGKAPQKLAERYLNRQYIHRDVVDRIVTESYLSALDEEKLIPVSHPALELISEFEEGKPFTFKATFERRPEITLGDYSAIDVEIVKRECKEEDVDATIDSLRQQRAVFIPVDGRSLNKGDFALIDFSGTVNGEPIEDGTVTGHFMEIADNAAIPGFVSGLVGMAKGEERIITVTLPLNFSPEYGGKDAQFKVTLNEIKEKQLPEVNDEFAKGFGPFENLEAMQQEVRTQINNSILQQEQSTIAEQAVKKVVDGVSIELPQSMINARVESLRRNLLQHLSQQGGTIAKYCEMRQITDKDLEQELINEATHQVKVDLFLDEVAKVEKLEVSDMEIDAELDRFIKSASGGLTKAKLKEALVKQGTIHDIRASLARQKGIKLLTSKAKVNYILPGPATDEASLKDSQKITE